ncbi:MAG: alpha/beta fold hydrolase, partial [Myxococcota bacterium]
MELILAIGYLLIGGLAIYAFSRIHLLFWRAYHHTDTCPDAIHFAQTDDGWRVALHRYRRPERATRAAPVLLCPGMMVNRRLMDLTPDRSLARTLSDVGFDVWVLEVRGVGASTRPSWLHNRTWEITFEDFVDRDAPAAIGLIRAQTGADRVHWMGHGLGGMIGAAVAQQPTSKLASLALIGSSGRPKLPAGVRFGVSMAWMLSWLPSASTKALSAFLAPFYIPTPLDAVLVRSENLAPEAARVALAHMAEDLPMPLLRQCSRWAMVGEMVSSRDDRNFTQALDQIQVPLLGVAADDDRLATPSAVRYAVERAASTRKAYINIGGEGAGARLTPCGHLDMLIGDAAARDVFPRLAGWLAQVEGLELEALAQLSRQDDTSQPTPAAKPSTPVVAEDKTETPSTVVFPEPSVVPMVARGGGDQEGEMADDDLLSAPLENSSSVSQEAPLFMEVRADVPPTDSTEPREHNAHEDDAAPKADDEEEPWASSAVPLAEALQAPPVLGGQEAQPQLPTDEGLVVAVPGLSPSRD